MDANWILIAVLSVLAAVPARAQLVTSSYLNASSATLTSFGVGTAAGTSLVDVRGGQITMEQAPVEVFLSSAVQSGGLTTTTNSVWYELTGTTSTFTLARTMIVNMRAHGAVEAGVTGVGVYYCAYAFVVDGVAKQNSTFGSALVYPYGVLGAGYWIDWNMEIEVSLTAGTHTVSVQMTSSANNGCTEDNGVYDAAQVWVHGR